ncbi:MAG: MBL fold metallo-hydrolase [Paracoccaceae bacterium]
MTIYSPTRRDLIRLAALTPALAIPGMLRAELAPPRGGQAAGWFRFSLGALDITIVSDGNINQPANGLAVNAPDGELAAFLAAHRLAADVNYAHTNHVLIQNGTDTLLVDVGSGSRFQSGAGRLMGNLAAAGIDTGAVTHVALTHAHPDHIWGLRDDFDELILPDAAYFMGRAEYENWTAPGLVNRVDETMQQFVVGAVNSLEVVEPLLSLVGDGAALINGVTMIDTPGHTAGHMGLYVESDGQKLLVLGDSIAHAYISFERPDWTPGVDALPDIAVAMRRKLMDWAAAENIALAGYHFPFPGVGHVLKEGDAYRFLPALWNWG